MIYRVMVVDDDQMVLEYLRTAIQWEKHGFCLAFCANNGVTALEELETSKARYDLVITDIDMPLMNGIELIRAIGRMQLKPTVVTLSVYNDYELVRESFKLGAVDYIIKTNLQEVNIIQLLQNVLKPAVEQRCFSFLDRELIRDILFSNETRPMNAGQIEDYILNHVERNARIKAALIHVEEYSALSIRERFDAYNNVTGLVSGLLMNAAEKLCHREFGEELCILTLDQKLVFFLAYSSDDAESGALSRMDEMLRQYHTRLKHDGVTTSIGISAIWDGIENLSNAYLQAKSYLELKEVLGSGRVVGTSCPLMPEGRSSPDEAELEAVTASCEKLISRLESSDFEGARKEKTELCLLLTKLTDRREQLAQTMLMICLSLDIFLINNGLEAGYFLGVDNYRRLIWKADGSSPDTLLLWIGHLIAGIVRHFEDLNRDSKLVLLEKVKRYIDRNLDQQLYLSDISRSIGISENYLSSLFSKYCGEPVSYYINRKRVEQAKHLLMQSSLSANEIALQVGYQNYEHFSRTFKKLAGVSPASYRQA